MYRHDQSLVFAPWYGDSRTLTVPRFSRFGTVRPWWVHSPGIPTLTDISAWRLKQSMQNEWHGPLIVDDSYSTISVNPSSKHIPQTSDAPLGNRKLEKRSEFLDSLNLWINPPFWITYLLKNHRIVWTRFRTFQFFFDFNIFATFITICIRFFGIDFLDFKILQQLADPHKSLTDKTNSSYGMSHTRWIEIKLLLSLNNDQFGHSG